MKIIDQVLVYFQLTGENADDSRRRTLLNLMIVGISIGTAITFLVLLVIAPDKMRGGDTDIQMLVIGFGVTMLGMGGIYFINRYLSGKAAAIIFLILLIAVAAISDNPEQVANGRGLAVFTIPILAASFILSPWVSFAAAAGSSLVVIGIGIFILGNQIPNIPAVLVLFSQALISWLSSRTLEDALKKRRLSEERLRESEDRLSKIMIAANDGMWDWDLQSNDVFFDRRYYEMAGYEVNEFPHRLEEFQNRVHPGDIHYVMRQAELHLTGKIDRFDVEFRFRTKQAGWIWILGRGVIVERDQDGTPLRFVGTHTDITERKSAEEKFRIIFESAPDAYYLSDLEGHFIEGNKAAENITGYRREELIGKNFMEVNLLPADQISKAAGLLIRNKQGIATGPREFSLRCKDGSIVEVEISTHPVEIEGQKCILGIARDITVRKQAEKELAKYRLNLENLVEERTEELQVAVTELESFTYSVSHDLRAPLRHIDSFVGLLLERSQNWLDEQSHRYLDIIADSSQRMGQLIDDLLQLSRTSRVEIDTRQVDLNKMIENIIEEHSYMIEEKVVHWDIQALPEVMADPGLIRIVWTNLIINAIKFSSRQEKPQIEIGCYSRQTSMKMLKELQEENRVRGTTGRILYIRDNGVGFDQQYTEKIFGVFQRLHQREEFEGTGIGLAIVKRILDKHGGDVWAEGQQGKGATFYLSLEEIPVD